MAAIDFPNNPNVNDTYTVGSRTWVWNGTFWEAVGAIGPQGTSGVINVTSPITNSGTTTEAQLGLDQSAITIAQSQVTNLSTDLTDKISKTIFDAQGDLIVASAADTPARLPIGTNGQILTSNGTTASWQTPASSGSLALLSSTTPNGVITTIDSINQGYKHLLIAIKNVRNTSSSSGTTLQVRLNGSSSLTTRVTTAFNGSTVVTGSGLGESLVPHVANLYISTEVTRQHSFWIYVYDYASTTAYKNGNYFGNYNDTSSTSYASSIGSYVFRSVDPVTSVAITTGLGVALNAGTIEIYGVN